MARILVVEDEADLQQVLEFNLKQAGHEVSVASRGAEALRLVREQRPELILLDLMLPDMLGTEVCRIVKQSPELRSTLVVMVTAKGEEADRVVGFELGADDYVVKPFNPAEVAARVRAVLRRTRRAEWDGHALLRVGPLEIDLEAFRVAVVAGDASRHVLTLTLTEFRLLAHLARAPRRVSSRAELIAACLPEGEVLERTVDSHISKLRRKLEEVGVEGMPVSLRGVGYRLEETA